MITWGSTWRSSNRLHQVNGGKRSRRSTIPSFHLLNATWTPVIDGQARSSAVSLFQPRQSPNCYRNPGSFHLSLIPTPTPTPDGQDALNATCEEPSNAERLDPPGLSRESASLTGVRRVLKLPDRQTDGRFHRRLHDDSMTGVGDLPHHGRVAATLPAVTTRLLASATPMTKATCRRCPTEQAYSSAPHDGRRVDAQVEAGKVVCGRSLHESPLDLTTDPCSSGLTLIKKDLE
jgi:hypothetical protein